MLPVSQYAMLQKVPCYIGWLSRLLQLVLCRTLLKLGLPWVVFLSLQTEFGICSYSGEGKNLWSSLAVIVIINMNKLYCATEFLSKYFLTWMNLIHWLYVFHSISIYQLCSISPVQYSVPIQLARLYGLPAWPVSWHHCTECGILLKCESVWCAHVFLCATESSCYSPVASVIKSAPFVSVHYN